VHIGGREQKGRQGARAMKHNALVFDIETIADITPDNRDAITALSAKREVTAEDYASLCPPLARVVCIAWLDVTAQKLGALFDASLCTGECSQPMQVEGGDGNKRKCELQGCEGEAEILRRFGRLVEEHLGQSNSQLVTYNGRGFDLPVLIHRSIKHRITEGRELLMKAMSENRYRPLLHVDLQDAVTFCGATGRFPMAAYAIGYGWRSPKADMHGAQVGAAVRDGRIIDVVRYCVGDVLATAHIYLSLNDLQRGPGTGDSE
jgi:DNA polymerase elongation subunit (family B)